MKIKKRIILILIIIIIMFLLNNTVEAKSYYIKNMTIDATVLDNGDVDINQTFEYEFDGQYNGVYLTIPIKNKSEKAQINDDFYNPTEVEIKQITTEKNEETLRTFRKVNNANIGDRDVYIEEKKNNMYKLQIFSPSQNENKIFKVNYIMKNLCVNHNDYGELYYNFIGGEGDCLVENLEINIIFPNNTEELKAWGHGPDNGKTEILDKNTVNFRVSNVGKGKYVAARVMFDKTNIQNSTKLSNMDIYDLILEEEKNIAQINDKKINYTKNIALFSMVLIMYWLVLLIIYEIEKKIPSSNINEEELFEKYNPMLAGCIQGSRDILARDIIAVILNLIDKKCIELEIIGNTVGKDRYIYFIKKVPEKEIEMDEIEKFIYDWIFGSYKIDDIKHKGKKYKINDDILLDKDKTRNTIELNYALKKLSEDKNTGKKFKILNEKVQKTLNKQGANKIKVPIFLKIINTIIFIITVFLVINHIKTVGIVSLEDNSKILSTIYMIGIIALQILPITLIIIYIPIYIIITIRHKVSKLLQKVTGQKVVNTTVAIILIFVVIIIITLLLTKNNSINRYLLADEILLCISLIIMLTDNLMMKNEANRIEDFSRLNLLKKKIEYYSLINEKDVEQIYLWDKYLAYGVSFGIAGRIMKRISQIYLDDDLMKLIKDVEFTEFINSNYYIFYTNSSLDKRFLKSYIEKTTEIFNNTSGDGFDNDSGGGSFFGGGGSFSGGSGFSRRPAEVEAVLVLSNKKKKDFLQSFFIYIN